MPAPRGPLRGRRRPRPDRARLVGIADLLSTSSGFPSEEDQAAYAAGLRAARLLRLHFPDIFDSLVRDLLVTPASMLATMELFVNLADDKFFHVDLCRAEFHSWLKDPIAQFPKTLEEKRGANLDTVLEEVLIDRDLIWDPTPQVFGLDRSPDYTDPKQHPFAVAVWKLLLKTTLATIRENTPGSLARMVGAKTPAGKVIAHLAPLPEGTDVQALCEALDQHKPGGRKGLGTAILYVAGMTGNQYADTTYNELMDWYGNYGIDWAETEHLAEIKEVQEEAILIAAQYGALNKAFYEKPRTFRNMFAGIHRIARELRLQKQERPKTLIDLFVPTELEMSPLGQPYYPIDIGRDTEELPELGVEVLGPVWVLSATDPHAFGGATPLRDQDRPPTPAESGGDPPG